MYNWKEPLRKKNPILLFILILFVPVFPFKESYLFLLTNNFPIYQKPGVILWRPLVVTENTARSNVYPGVLWSARKARITLNYRALSALCCAGKLSS